MRPKSPTMLITPNVFQSTHPLRDATVCNKADITLTIISIHAPLTGCDISKVISFSLCPNFNPRTPYGMRRSWYFAITISIKISIHAPLTGCDITIIFIIAKLFDFNPRTPYGMRLSYSYF